MQTLWGVSEREWMNFRHKICRQVIGNISICVWLLRKLEETEDILDNKTGVQTLVKITNQVLVQLVALSMWWPWYNKRKYFMYAVFKWIHCNLHTNINEHGTMARPIPIMNPLMKLWIASNWSLLRWFCSAQLIKAPLFSWKITNLFVTFLIIILFSGWQITDTKKQRRFASYYASCNQHTYCDRLISAGWRNRCVWKKQN